MIGDKLAKGTTLLYSGGGRVIGSLFGGMCPVKLNPVFIVSPPRSGSTLLAEILGMHPGLARWKGKHPPLGNDHRDPLLPTELYARDVRRRNRQRLRRILSFFQWCHASPVLIKEVHASLRLDALIEALPDLRLVVLFRDGRASVESLIRTIMADPTRQKDPFGRYGRPRDFQDWHAASWLEKMCHLWKTYIRSIRDATTRLPESQCVQIRYEDLCRDTRAEVNRLDQHLGLDAAKRDWELVPPELPNYNWKFPKYLSPAEQAAIEAQLGDLLVELGYSGPCT